MNGEALQVLIRQARHWRTTDSLAMHLAEGVRALGSVTIVLWVVSAFRRHIFRKTKAAAKVHTLLDLRDNVPASSSQRRQAARRQCVR